MSLDEFLGPRDVARLTSLSTSTLLRMRRRGDGPPWLPLSAGRVGYPKRGLEAWLNEQAAKSA